MKLTRGTGNPETGGCWMAVNDYYVRGVLDWTDQPECVDPIIRSLAIKLNDWCEDGEREELIGPHIFAPLGTHSVELMPARLEKLVRFALDCAADALDRVGVEHKLRQNFGRDYGAARAAAEAADAAAWDALADAVAAAFADAAAVAAACATDAAEAARDAARDADRTAAAARAAARAAYIADGKQRLLDLILELCAMGTPQEVVGKVTKEEALKVVCKK